MITTIFILDGAPRTHYFSSNSKAPQIGQFEVISSCQKIQKWVIIIIQYPNLDPGTRKEPFQPMWLKLWEHGERKTR